MNELQQAYIYTDKYPFLELRKRINLMMAHISYRTLKFAKNPLFEYLTLSMIVFNSVVLAIDDPKTNVQSSFQDTMDIKHSYRQQHWQKCYLIIWVLSKIVTGALPYLIAQLSQLSNAVLVMIFAFTVFYSRITALHGLFKQRSFAGFNGIVQMTVMVLIEPFVLLILKIALLISLRQNDIESIKGSNE